MKTFFGIVLIGLIFVCFNDLRAERPYGKAGCGLGSLVMGKEGLTTQVFAATTNQTSYTQLSGISSGTSNCTDPNSSAALYIRNNQLALSNDIAKGNGETIVGLAKAYHCSNASELGSKLQQNYSNIFPSSTTRAGEIESSIRSVISLDKALSSSCELS